MSEDTTDKTKSAPDTSDAGNTTEKVRRRHLIRNPWIRIPLKTLMWILLIVILIPVLLYVPPVQTFVKNIACKVVRNSTGMDVSIDSFRLRWPLDVSLKGVTVLEESGDTMVNAREVIADVKLMPLLNLDVKINRLSLIDGYYRMVSPDSSMIMKIRAGRLEADSQSSADLRNMRIMLNKASLKDGDVSLFMDVWKKQPTPEDTTATPFYISAGELSLENFTFRMGMLPTIDTLVFNTRSLILKKGVIDLEANSVTAGYLGAAGGDVTYLTPTAEYIATHPAPVDTISAPTPPMVIRGDSVDLSGFSALYAVKDATPLPGFDPSYIQADSIYISVSNFYNAATTLRLPIASMRAKERSGLDVRSANGLIALDETGISLDGFTVVTPWTSLSATASIPFALMEMKPEAPLNIDAFGWIGMPDVEAFMPDLITYTSKIPGRTPLDFSLKTEGTLSDAKIPKLSVSMPGIFGLNAEGYAANALDIKKMRAYLDFDGAVTNPGVIDNIMGDMGFKMPSLKLKGNASADHETYATNFSLLTSAGDVAADGKVSLTAESYKARVDVRNLDVAHFAPTAGVGAVTARLQAEGAGFNPERPRTHTDIRLDISSVRWQRQLLKDIRAELQLNKGVFTLDAVSDNPAARLNISGHGTIDEDLYTFDVDANLRHLDLQAIGLSETPNAGNAVIHIAGNASPAKWNYAVGMEASDINWTLDNQTLAFPGDIALRFDSDPVSVNASLDALLTTLSFKSDTGLKDLISRFTATGDTVTRQLKDKFINIEGIQRQLPPFTLAFDASGRGTLGRYLNTIGFTADTIHAVIANDSILSGGISTLAVGNASMRADTLTFKMHQKGDHLLYLAHMGNRPNNPLAEFADVNLGGYIGTDRVNILMSQKNQKGKTGYKLGLTASYADSVATVRFNPLKATIAYFPWEINDGNFVSYNIINHRVEADLSAKSHESSILLQTVKDQYGSDALHVALDNIKVQDFLGMVLNAPPVTASVNADLNVGYAKGWLKGNGDISVSDLYYEKTRVGNFDLGLRGGLNNDGTTAAAATLKIDGHESLMAKALLKPDSAGVLTPANASLQLKRFPLQVGNAFLGKDVARLSGYLNGKMSLGGSFTAPILNGNVGFDSVGVYIPMMGQWLEFDNDSISVADNVLNFDRFNIWGANDNPLLIDGTVDARRLSAIALDLSMKSKNFQLVGSKKSGGNDIYGKLFLDLDATARGQLDHFSVNAKVNVLNSTDITYSVPQTTAQLTQMSDAGNVVKFVNFNDTTKVLATDTIAPVMSMRIVAALSIEPGTRVHVDIPGTLATGNGKVDIQPNGTLNYFQNYMGDMRLNGQLNIPEGDVEYSLPIRSLHLSLQPTSYVRWSGDLMNPQLNIAAVDEMKTNLLENGNSRFVNFLITLNVANTLSAPKITFDLSTNDDMSIQNDLLSMSADQRSMAAINLLLTGQYSGQGVRTASSDLAQGMLFGMVTSSINNLLASKVKFVNLSLGVDQYDKTVNGESSSSMSYSYTMSKSLFNDRFKISVGGNYTTDASADENFSENLISDISFEYILRQNETMTLLARLFRHTGFESILEGEITETGVGLVMKRRLNNLFNLFNFLPQRFRRDDDDDTDQDAAVSKEPAKEPEQATDGNGTAGSDTGETTNN